MSWHRTGSALAAVTVLGLASLGASAVAMEYKEAPELAAMVAAGTLPPLAERLPSEPMVITPQDSIGNYGGVWRSTVRGSGDSGWIRRIIYDPLVAFSYDWNEVQPNLAKSFSVNEDATEYTFELRTGMKWSDGEPFTADDIVFAIEDVMKNDEYLGQRPALEFSTIHASAVDADTLKIMLDRPNSLLLQALASVDGGRLIKPKHYCSQFHIKYNPAADELAKSEGLQGWPEALEKHCAITQWGDVNVPTLGAWQIVTPYDGVNLQISFKRNPYYFKVDPEGNQLPYIDGLEITQTENVEDIVLKALNGEIDMSNRHLALPNNKAVFVDGQEKGNYHLYDTVDARMNTVIFQLNLTSEDEAKRKLYGEKDFRIALSEAIDRQEIIDVVFAGQGEPWQAAPRPESKYYNEELAKQYTAYDPDHANELLDGLGLTERNADGLRLGYDGQPIRLNLNTTSDWAEYNDVAELVKAYWADVGIDLDVRNVERNFVYETFRGNKHDIHVWQGDGGLGDALLDPRYYFPFNLESAYGIPWARWFESPESEGAEEPPAAVAEQQELYRQMKAAKTPAEADAKFAEILDIAQDQFWVIGISLPAGAYGVAQNDMGNVPQNQPFAWIYPNPGPMNTALLYKKQ